MTNTVSSLDKSNKRVAMIAKDLDNHYLKGSF